MTTIFLSFNVAEWTSENNQGTTEFSYRGLIKLLKLLDAHDVKATFFITGYFAQHESKIVQAICHAGHEIGCYGLENKPHHAMGPKQFYEETRLAKQILEKITGTTVNGYRCPGFRAPKSYQGILATLGFSFDSSSHPAFIPGSSYPFLRRRLPHMIGSLHIREIPVTVSPLLKLPLSMPFMRTFGTVYTKVGIEFHILTHSQVVLYGYPWEAIPLHRMKGNPFLTRNTGARYRQKLDALIWHFKRLRYRFDVLSHCK